MASTRWPRRAASSDSIIVVVDFPTPPLPYQTARRMGLRLTGTRGIERHSSSATRPEPSVVRSIENGRMILLLTAQSLGNDRMMMNWEKPR